VKPMLTVVRDDDAGKVVDTLAAHGFHVTPLSGMGGFLRMGNTVPLAGVEDGQLEQMVTGRSGEAVCSQDRLMVPG